MHYYSHRGYPQLIEMLNQVLQIPPTPPPDSQEEQNMCVVTYYPCNPQILDILRYNWKIHECTPTLKCISSKHPKLGYRCNANLRYLTPSALKYHIPTKTNNHSVGWQGVFPQLPTLEQKWCLFELRYKPELYSALQDLLQTKQLSLLVHMNPLWPKVCRRI